MAPISPPGMLGKPTVKKASQVVMAASKGNIKLVDHKLFNYLLARVYRRLNTDQIHRIPVKDVLDFLGHTSTDKILESLDRLRKVDIEIEYVQDGKLHKVGARYLSYDITRSIDGMLEYAFDPILMRFLFEPKVYATLNLTKVRQFRGRYAEKLYEIMQLHANMRDPVWSVDVEEFRRRIEVPDSSMDRFDNLRRNVIEKAVSEVNELAEFDVAVEYVKGGRGGKVRELRFRAVEKSLALVHGGGINLADPIGKKPRKANRDTDTVDLIDGMTDRERGGDIPILPQTMDRAIEMAGSVADAERMLDEWRDVVSGRRIRDPDTSFIAWMEGKKASTAETDMMADLDGDILAGLVDKWEEGV